MRFLSCFALFCASFQACLFGKVYMEKPEDFNPKVEVVGCFIDHEDKILLLHRQDAKSQGNTWGIPGGKLEKDESVNAAAIRETKEETGYNLDKHDVHYVGKVFIKYPNFDYVYHMVRCKPNLQPGLVKISFSEHKGFTWVTPQDALKMNLMLDEDTCIKMTYEIE